MKIAGNIAELIGKTPLVRINNLDHAAKHKIYAKLESFNPLSSVKDRIALAMIEDAEQKGLINSDTVIIEPTSGNTGIGLSYIAAMKGYRLILTMPESMSVERRVLMNAFGAELVLTPANQGMKGAIEKADELSQELPYSFQLRQFENPANPEIHRRTTAKEIWEDTEGEIDYLVSGIGTGGTITGVGEVLKEKKDSIKVIAVEPETSAVLSGDAPGTHKIQGIGAGFIPKILNTSIYDEIIRVSDKNAGQTSRVLARKEGIIAGISSGAAMWAALAIAEREKGESKSIVVILPDTGERYLSTWLFEEVE